MTVMARRGPWEGLYTPGKPLGQWTCMAYDDFDIHGYVCSDFRIYIAGHWQIICPLDPQQSHNIYQSLRSIHECTCLIVIQITLARMLSHFCTDYLFPAFSTLNSHQRPLWNEASQFRLTSLYTTAALITKILQASVLIAPERLCRLPRRSRRCSVTTPVLSSNRRMLRIQ